ncbi:Tubulin delta chain [Homalodisca vitripennis]|nr:Tubulin delta chain [Homalodisca vitripennis]
MAQVIMQFGQCGNQLGEELYTHAFNDIVASNSSYWNNSCSRDSWFHHTAKGLRARAVLVDTDSKVTGNIKKSPSWAFRSDNVVASEWGGAGNNFALGYCVRGPHMRDGVLDVLRKECERCDRVRGFMALSSCAGGTGSGVGTFILEQIRDLYRNKNLISVLVMPYFSGEVVTQNNNTLFTLSRQYEVCDALIVFENDMISNLIMHQLRPKNITFLDLNKVIVQNLLSFLQPLQSQNHSKNLYDILSQLCHHPDYKFLAIQSLPVIKESKTQFDTQPSWTSIERDMIRYLKTSLYSSNAPKVDFINAVANTVISRGETIPNHTITKIKSLFFSPSWVPPNFSFCHYHQPRQLLNQEKSLTLVSNNGRITGLLDTCLSKSWKLFTNNMYVHHYYKFGFTKNDFLETFLKSEKMLKAYNNLGLH